MEFFIRSNRPLTPFELAVNYYRGGSLIKSVRTSAYNPNFLVDSGWTFMRIPLSDFNSTGMWSSINFAPYKEQLVYDSSYNVSMSQVRFSTQPATYFNTFKQVCTSLFKHWEADPLQVTAAPVVGGGAGGAPNNEDGALMSSGSQAALNFVGFAMLVVFLALC